MPALRHRLEVFQRYLDDLPADRGLEERARSIAKKQFRRVVREMTRESEYVLSRSAGLDSLTGEMRPLLTQLTQLTAIADETFEGGVGDVPPFLVRAVRRELAAAKIDVWPLVRVVSPGNFETNSVPLWDAIYPPGMLPDVKEPNEKIFVFGVPPVEGIRALWSPITAGHEVAHVYEATRRLINANFVEQWLPDRPPRGALAGLRARVAERRPAAIMTLVNWAREVFCDLFMLKRYGPAAIAAHGEFLATVAVESTYQLSTHPPATYRIGMMCSQLGDTPEVYEPLMLRWLEWLDEEPEIVEPHVAYLLDTLEDHREEIASLVEEVPCEPYDCVSRGGVVEELCAWLEMGVPQSELEGDEVGHADVVNAGWLAYSRRALGYAAPSGPGYEALDRLVGKALDDVDFLDLWGRQREKRNDSLASVSSGPGPGVQGAGELERRLNLPRQDGSGHRLVVAPRRSTLEVSGATVDVRVGKGFIVFRRSGTRAFNAIAAKGNPRDMQDLIQKDWGEEFILHPGELVLAATLEYLQLPDDLTAQVMTRSSYGRLGLLSATAVQVQPGYSGCLTLELVNLGQVPMALTPGERIAQLAFTSVYPQARDSHRKYRFPVGPEFSRVASDSDLARLTKMARRQH